MSMKIDVLAFLRLKRCQEAVHYAFAGQIVLEVSENLLYNEMREGNRTWFLTLVMR